MPPPTDRYNLARLSVLAALCVLGTLSLSGCLPLQFGVEPATGVATRVARVTGATTASTPTRAATTVSGTATRTPLNGQTLTPSPVRSATVAATTLIPTSTPPAPATDTPRPPATAVDCALSHSVRQGEGLAQIGVLYDVPWQTIASLNDLSNPALIFAGQVLCLPPGARLTSTPTRTPTRVASATSPTSTASPSPSPCPPTPAWYVTPLPPVCPATAPLISQAAAQRFERGQMLWIAALDQYVVLFDGSAAATRFMTYLPGPLDLKPGASADNRVPATPPSGLEQPVSGFGLIWRGEVVGSESVRAALGWATQAEFAYSTNHQCQASTTVEWSCYRRGPGGHILRLYYTPGVGYFWDNW